MSGWHWVCFGCDAEVDGIQTEAELEHINDEHWDNCPGEDAATAARWES